MDFGLDMIALPSHASHAFQPLDVSYFKPFKTTFRKERDVTMIVNKYRELNKITHVRWVDKTIDQSLTKDNIRSRFKVTNI
jgi:hypothetical protein